MHKQYSRYRIDYDFALMKLAKPVIMNDHVRLICLPRSTSKLPVGTVLWETGWGRTSHHGEQADYLKELEVIIVDPKLSPYRVCVEFPSFARINQCAVVLSQFILLGRLLLKRPLDSSRNLSSSTW